MKPTARLGPTLFYCYPKWTANAVPFTAALNPNLHGAFHLNVGLLDSPVTPCCPTFPFLLSRPGKEKIVSAASHFYGFHADPPLKHDLYSGTAPTGVVTARPTVRPLAPALLNHFPVMHF